ncbi:MAG: response regulator transcription factor [Niabella sp.]
MKNNIKHILVVDDEPAILKLLEFVLSKEYSVTLKGNGYEAIAWLEEGNTPDLIVLDIEMPYFNGSEFLKSIKISGLFNSIPVIVLTGAVDLEKLKSEMRFPADVFMQKPFNPEKLQDAVRSLLKPNSTPLSYTAG